MADETILEQDVLTAVNIANPAEWFFGVERLGFTTPHQIALSEIGVALVDPVDADITALDARLDAAEAQLLTLVNVTGDITALDTRVGVNEANIILMDGRIIALETMPLQLNVTDNVTTLALETPLHGDLWQTKGYTAVGDEGAEQYRYDGAAADTIDGGWVLDGPGSVGRYLAVDRSVANVRHFGAVGDGVTDDTAAFQAALAASEASGIEVYVPAGFYVISATLQIPARQGFKLRGSGRVQEVYALPNPNIKGSVIIWQGPVGGTMLQWQCSGGEMTGIALWGKKDGDATQAGIGLEMVAALGIGTGHSSFDQIAIHDCDQGIAANGTTNEADFWFGLIRIRNCPTCVFLDNPQSVNWIFSYLSAQNATNVFEVIGGGNLNVHHVYNYNIVRMLYVTATGLGVGSNNASYRFGLVAMDGGGQTVRPTFVEFTAFSGGERLVSIEAIRQSLWAALADNTPQFILKGDVQCNVSNASNINLDKKVFDLGGSVGGSPCITFRGCKLSGLRPYTEATFATIATVSSSKPTYTFEKCTDIVAGALRGAMIGDFGNNLANLVATVVSGDATPSVQTLSVLTTANAVPTTITALDDGYDGQTVTVRIGDANTTVDFTGTTLSGNGAVDWLPSQGDHMTCTRIAGQWHCEVSNNTYTEPDSIINVRLFGATGDGVTDDTLAIQAAIDHIYARAAVKGDGASLYIPAGRYLISTTLDFYNLIGLRVFGDGVDRSYIEPTVAFPRIGSTLVWNGAVGGTLMTGGMQTFSFTDMTFWGKPILAGTRAGFGFHLTATAGISAGRGSFFRCAFVEFDTAIQCGTAVGDTGCDLMHLDAVAFRTCSTAFKAVNTASVGHHVGMMICTNVDTCFLFSGGGNLSVSHLNCEAINTVLQINGDVTGVGQNNSSFIFEFVNIYAASTLSPTLVATEKVEAAGNRVVKFNSARINPSTYKGDGRYLVDVSGSIYVYLSDIQYLDAGGTIARLDSSFNYDPRVLFDRCTLDVSTEVAAGFSQTPTFVTFVGTGAVWGFKETQLLATNLKLPDIGNHPSLDFRSGNYAALPANDATPDVSGLGLARTNNSVATTITALDNGVDGQTIVIAVFDNNTTIDFTATTLKGNGGADWTPVVGDHMVCTLIAGNWYCQISDNTA